MQVKVVFVFTFAKLAKKIGNALSDIAKNVIVK